MPAERLSMRKTHEILRLRFGHGLSRREISRSTSVSRSTVADYLLRASAAGLSWPLPEGMDEAALERLLFPSVTGGTHQARPLPDWPEVQRELRRKGVTLALLWQEYKEKHPDGYQYSWFCKQYEQWQGSIDLVMRQEHRAGEKLFVDYAGMTMGIVDPETGEVKESQIFVAALGASNYTYCEATWSQGLPDWISSHVRTFAFLGGVPVALVPDNLKSGVHRASAYDPELNPTYQDLATHYGVAVLPARVRAPRDKAKVETAVQIVERQILARLRNHTFFSLQELNRELRRLLAELNAKPFQKLPGSRQSMFESIDRPALAPLPSAPYEFAEWKKATVHIDYHVEVGGHYYSVPYQLVKKQLDVRITATTVECFHKGNRVASHRRSLLKGRHTTVREHMPPRHRKYADWTPERFLRWAAKVGPHTAGLAEKILATRAHPQQAYRTLLGIMRLGGSYSEQRLEAACARALAIDAVSFRSVESILKNGLDNKPLPDKDIPSLPLVHDNIRGAQYYLPTIQ
ncbi:MAG: IS21 family transposase [Thermodesulfobacteriota bacterium]